MEFGLCLEPLVAAEGLDAAVEFTAGAGYDGCELALWDVGDLGPDGAGVPAGTDRERVRRLLDRHGLDAVGIYRPFRPESDYSVTAPDPEVRRRTAEHLAAVADVCGDLGAEVIVFGSPEQRRIPDGADREDALATAAETLRSPALLESLDRHGVTLCVEPLTWGAGLLETAREGAAFVERVDHPAVGLVLDGYHMVREVGSTEGVVRLIEDCGARLAHVHADDGSMRGPGDGDLDYRAVLSALDGVGYDGSVSVEFHAFYREPTDRRESATDPPWREMATASAEYLSGL